MEQISKIELEKFKAKIIKAARKIEKEDPSVKDGIEEIAKTYGGFELSKCLLNYSCVDFQKIPGTRCQLYHPGDDDKCCMKKLVNMMAKAICRHDFEKGYCRYGTKCIFRHSKDMAKVDTEITQTSEEDMLEKILHCKSEPLKRLNVQSSYLGDVQNGRLLSPKNLNVQSSYLGNVQNGRGLSPKELNMQNNHLEDVQKRQSQNQKRINVQNNYLENVQKQHVHNPKELIFQNKTYKNIQNKQLYASKKLNAQNNYLGERQNRRLTSFRKLNAQNDYLNDKHIEQSSISKKLNVQDKHHDNVNDAEIKELSARIAQLNKEKTISKKLDSSSGLLSRVLSYIY